MSLVFVAARGGFIGCLFFNILVKRMLMISLSEYTIQPPKPPGIGYALYTNTLFTFDTQADFQQYLKEEYGNVFFITTPDLDHFVPKGAAPAIWAAAFGTNLQEEKGLSLWQKVKLLLGGYSDLWAVFLVILVAVPIAAFYSAQEYVNSSLAIGGSLVIYFNMVVHLIFQGAVYVDKGRVSMGKPRVEPSFLQIMQHLLVPDSRLKSIAFGLAGPGLVWLALWGLAYLVPAASWPLVETGRSLDPWAIFGLAAFVSRYMAMFLLSFFSKVKLGGFVLMVVLLTCVVAAIQPEAFHVVTLWVLNLAFLGLWLGVSVRIKKESWVEVLLMPVTIAGLFSLLFAWNLDAAQPLYVLAIGLAFGLLAGWFYPEKWLRDRLQQVQEAGRKGWLNAIESEVK